MSLLAIAVCQATYALKGSPLSRAGSLLQWIFGGHDVCVQHKTLWEASSAHAVIVECFEDEPSPRALLRLEVQGEQVVSVTLFKAH